MAAAVLLAVAATLLMFAVFGFFEDWINDALNALPITSPSEEFSSIIDLVVSFAAFGIIILVNLLWLPSFLVGSWTLTALAGLCLLAAGYIRIRTRKRGQHSA